MEWFRVLLVVFVTCAALVYGLWNGRYYLDKYAPALIPGLPSKFPIVLPTHGSQSVRILLVSKIDFAVQLDLPYLLILPDEVSPNNISQATLSEAINLLETIGYLNAVGGNNGFNQTIYCSGSISDWTLHLSTNLGAHVSQLQQSKIEQNATSHVANNCKICFLLPYGPILFRRSAFLQALKNFESKAPGGYSKYGVGFLYSLLVSLNNTGAHCSGLNFIATAYGSKTFSDLTHSSQSDICSQTFGFAFDQKFPLLADLLGIYRIVLPGGKEAWLDCEWDQRLLNSSAACANWLFRYLLDSTRLFSDYFHWDYRLLYGTALGAIRDGDIIPWTTDLDVIPVPFKSGKRVDLRAYIKNIQRASKNMYDYITIDKDPHYAPYRMVPRCPMILYQSGPTDSKEMAAISKLFISKETTKKIASDWRNVPYVDVYETNHLNTKYNSSYHDNLDEMSDLANINWSKIRGVAVKIIDHPEKYLIRWFGPKWAIPPRRKGGFSGRIDGFE